MLPRNPNSLAKLFLGALVALGLSGAAQAQTQRRAPPAGTRIQNRAETTYDYAGFTVRLQSNPVEIEVAPVEAVALVPNSFRSVTPGAFVSLPHRLTNTGNVATTYALQLAPRGDNTYALADLRLVRDLDANGIADGIADGGEPEVTSIRSRPAKTPSCRHRTRARWRRQRPSRASRFNRHFERPKRDRPGSRYAHGQQRCRSRSHQKRRAPSGHARRFGHLASQRALQWHDRSDPDRRFGERRRAQSGYPARRLARQRHFRRLLRRTQRQRDPTLSPRGRRLADLHYGAQRAR